jgi:hypothetical protein
MKPRLRSSRRPRIFWPQFGTANSRNQPQLYTARLSSSERGLGSGSQPSRHPHDGKVLLGRKRDRPIRRSSFVLKTCEQKLHEAHRATEWETNSCGKLSKIHDRSFVQLQRVSGHAASFEQLSAGPFNRTFQPSSTFRVRSRNAQGRRVYGVLIFHRFVNGMSVSFSHSHRISTQWPCS